MKSKKGTILIAIFMILLPFLIGLVCIGIGRYSLSVGETVDVLVKGLTGQEDLLDATAKSVIFSIRLPRIFLAIFVGAGLATAGAAFQGLFTNPLATPDTLGVASGASFGAVLALTFDRTSLMLVQIMALIFGLLSVALTCSISKIKGKQSIIMVVLSGMVVSSLCQAFVSLVKYVADPEQVLPSITYWLMGSLASASFKSLLVGLPFIIIGVVSIFLLRWRLNIMSLNEEEAQSMGVNVKRLRLWIILASTMITASCVSMCGQVGWIGLLVPHIARMIRGSNNRYVIPISISLGATFMIIIDTIARAATSAEIPVSILTAIIGAPFFIALLRKTGGAWL